MLQTIKKWLPYIAIIILIIFLVRSCNGRKADNKEARNFLNALNDTVSHYKNKHGEDVATISVLQLQSAKDFLKVSSKDVEIQELQQVVKDYKSKLKKPGSSATNFTATTKVTNTGKTTVTPRDTVKVGEITYVYPQYSDSLLNEWIEYRASMNKDSAKLDLKVNNKYSVIIGEEGGLFKKKRAFVDVVNYNPYSTVEKIRTFQVSQPRPKRFGLGMSVGVAINPNLKFTPYLGIGLQYNFIKF